MLAASLYWRLMWSGPSQGQEPGGPAALDSMLDAGFEVVVLLLAFTLAVFVLLVFAVRALMIFRKLPVPTDPFDMTKPRAFRALMLGSAVLLTPLVASSFLPVEGLDSQSVLVVAYGFEILLGVALWVVLELFYRIREERSGPRT